MAHQTPSDAETDPLGELRSIVAATVASSTPAQRALAFGGIPTLLLLVGSLPLAQQHQWALHLDDPTPVQLYLSNFVHRDIPHLSNNILSYLFLMMLLFPLAVSAGRQRVLAVLSTLYLTVVPVLVSVSSIASLSGTGAEAVTGFSGVVAAYAGALPFFIAYHVNEKIAQVGVAIGGTGLMGLELGVVLWFAGLRRWSVGLLSVLGLIALGVALRERRVVATLDREYEIHLLVYGLVLFAAVPATLLVGAGPTTNVYGHLIGLISGFLSALVVVLGRSIIPQAFGWMFPIFCLR